MIKILSGGSTNVVFVELSNGTTFQLAEFETGELTVSKPKSPQAIATRRLPIRATTKEKEIMIR